MLTLHPRVVVMSAADTEAAESYQNHDEGCACCCVVAACFSLLLFVVLAAATGSLARACAIAAAAALLLGLASCLAPWWDGLPPATARRGQPAGGPARPAAVRLVVHHRCACGLADADINALPTFAYEPPAAAKGGNGGGDKPRGSAVLCAVCLEDVRAGEMVRQLPACRHLFHVECVDAWLRAHRTCPLCRCELPPRNATAKAVAVTTVESSADDALPPV